MASSWQSNDKSQQFEHLRRNIHAEVLIIGGGIAGILTEYLLKQKELQPILIDAGKIGHGAKMGTTSKITDQHNLIFVGDI